ncbi:FecR domain-containing protein [Sphingopyxis indica]|uniref:FecR family protein n=1 Tax=Sphingopyxis indica TaxID=436663 RepID=UPI002938DC91|nr:FecR domain-containing protein [Sphingopyxis indica]WOF41763.1 FecR domain-containing protein [Sphingopyxis indica]
MQADPTIAIDAEAAGWLIRQRDPAFADWDGFTDWLAADPAHAAAYDALASLDADLDALPVAEQPQIVWDAEPIRHRPSRRAWLGGALAAAIVGVIGVSSFGLFDDTQRIETLAGEHRSITLADGSKIEINGASTLLLDDDRPRFARLERGEAMFHVTHKDADPFVVEAGEAEIVDLGTAFNIVRGERRISIAVSEGIVAYNPKRENVRLAAGKGLEARDGAAPQVHDVEAATVGGWRTGLLVYNGAPLGEVAADLKRTAGIDVEIAPNAEALVFRGALVIDRDRARTMADLAALSGTRAERQGDGWVLMR